jgi:hypothetical protein
MAILEKLLVKGSAAFDHYLILKKELNDNEEKSIKYEKVVNSQSTREERRKSEDDLLN